MRYFSRLKVHSQFLLKQSFCRFYSLCGIGVIHVSGQYIEKESTVLHGFPADRENNIFQVKCVLERMEGELEACKKMSHAKTFQIKMIERTCDGM